MSQAPARHAAHPPLCPPVHPCCRFRISSLQAAVTLVVANGFDTTFSLGVLPGTPQLSLYSEDPSTGRWSRSSANVAIPPRCSTAAATPALSLPSGSYDAPPEGLAVSVTSNGAALIFNAPSPPLHCSHVQKPSAPPRRPGWLPVRDHRRLGPHDEPHRLLRAGRVALADGLRPGECAFAHMARPAPTPCFLETSKCHNLNSTLWGPPQGCSVVRAYASRADMQNSYEIAATYCLTGPGLAVCKGQWKAPLGTHSCMCGTPPGYTSPPPQPRTRAPSCATAATAPPPTTRATRSSPPGR